ncbi:MAG TPA: DUF3592 domain-containing protein [Mycobacteriales bacterium]|jgi:hypothetical protein|nr:DUF3592 domain-containing protein [Mycobacteriales bacterium]
MDTDPTRFLPLAFAAAGVLFVLFGVSQAVLSRRFAATAERVPGTVTALQYRSSGDGGVYYPVLRFRTLDGRDIDTVAMYGRSPAPARTGDRVDVLYDPADPSRALLPRAGGVLLPLAFVVLGLIALGVGTGLVELPFA